MIIFLFFIFLTTSLIPSKDSGDPIGNIISKIGDKIAGSYLKHHPSERVVNQERQDRAVKVTKIYMDRLRNPNVTKEEALKLISFLFEVFAGHGWSYILNVVSSKLYYQHEILHHLQYLHNEV
jgi:hypothetical protein